MNGDCLLCLVKEPGIMNFQQLPQRAVQLKIPYFRLFHNSLELLHPRSRQIRPFMVFCGRFSPNLPFSHTIYPFSPLFTNKKNRFFKKFSIFFVFSRIFGRIYPESHRKAKKTPK